MYRYAVPVCRFVNQEQTLDLTQISGLELQTEEVYFHSPRSPGLHKV
jgi:hypothetical protein